MVDGIVPGAEVEAGQLVGWVGDSGNAEDTDPHLHFELHRPNDKAIDPQKHLLAATVLDEPIGGSPKKAPPETDSSGGLPRHRRFGARRSDPVAGVRRGSRRDAPPTAPPSAPAIR